MANRLDEPDVKVEAQAPSICPSYFDYDTTAVAPTDQDLDEFDNLIDPSIFENNNPPLQNHARSIEETTRQGAPLASAVSSPAVPTQYFCIPFPSNEVVPMESTGWPAEFIPHWSEAGSRDNNNSITGSGSWDTSVSDLQSHTTRETSLASATTDPGKRKYGPVSQPDSSAWTRRNSITSEQSEQGFNNKDLGPSTVPKGTIQPSEDPMSTHSGANFDRPHAVVCISSRPPESSKRASSSRHAQSQQSQSQTRSPSPPPRPEQRARNRTAANKSRAKTKAATSELVATERAESLKHEELSTTFRGLQEEVFALKSQLLLHGNCDDQIIQAYLKKTARLLATGSRPTADSEPGNAASVANSGTVRPPG